MTDDLPGVLGGSRLLEQPRYRAELDAWRAFLAADRPVLLEIGFDHGRRLSRTAALHPGWGVAGLEIRRQRVEEARARADRMGTPNVLAWRVDARPVLAHHTPAGRLQVVEALFPDPWHHAAHRERRTLITGRFLDDVARALAPGGLLHLATDVPRYADLIRALVTDHPTLERDPDAGAGRPAIDASSRREWRCAQDGVPVHRFWLRRR